MGQDYESGDQQLEDALEQLKTIPQSTIAYEIGISERRLRDIERGRSRPRLRTREAILRLASDLREEAKANANDPTLAVSQPQSSASTNQSDASCETQAMPGWLALSVIILVGGFLAFAYFAGGANEA